VGTSSDHRERELDWLAEEAAEMGRNPLKGLARVHLCGR
jgi:hypothetical protein